MEELNNQFKELEINKPQHHKRLHVYTKIYMLLCKYISSEESYIKAINIEKSIYNASVLQYKGIVKSWNKIFELLYINKAVRIYSNLNPDCYLHNYELIEQLKISKMISSEIMNEIFRLLNKQNTQINNRPFYLIKYFETNMYTKETLNNVIEILNKSDVVLQSVDDVITYLKQSFLEIRIGFLKPEEMFPTKYNYLHQIHNKKYEIAKESLDYDSLIRCGKCKQYKVVYFEYCFRGDENTAKKCRCLYPGCGNTFTLY